MSKYYRRKLFDGIDREKEINEERIRVIQETLNMLNEH